MYTIKFEEYSPDGTRHVLGGPVSEETIIGRSPRSGITLPRASVSREHGKFFPVGSCWCYSDIGSTNGSWFEGRVIKKGGCVLVRPGDKVQIADTFVMVAKGEKDYTLSSGTVVVLEGGVSVGEADISSVPAFVIGGRDANLNVNLDSSSGDFFQFERRGADFYIKPLSGLAALGSDYPFSLNGIPIQEDVRLGDRDRIVFGEFQLLCNLPIVSDRNRASTVDMTMALGVPSAEGGSIAAGKAPTTRLSASTTTSIRAEQTVGVGDRRRSMSPISTFGQMPELTDSNEVKMDALLSPGLRGGPMASAGRSPTKLDAEITAKDKVYVAIGVIVFMGIILLGVFYILSTLGVI